MIGFVPSKKNYQEKLGKDDCQVLIECVEIVLLTLSKHSNTRLQILIKKLKRMEQQ